MRRLLALMLALACLILPAGSRADTPGFRLIGLPATLSAIAFAGDGTIFGTPARRIDANTINPPAALWRSGDHGRTWSVAYRPPAGSHLVVLAASPTAAYAYQRLPGQSARLVRIGIATGRVVPLDLQEPIAIDAAGTAYSAAGFVSPLLTRCPLTADTCDAFPMPEGSAGVIAVDPLSSGVLVTGTTSGLGPAVYRSTDAGATWIRGARADCAARCAMTFSGPAAETLYVQDDYDFKVSHDAGLSFGTHARQSLSAFGVIVGSRPAGLLRLYPGLSPSLARTTDEGASFQAVTLPGSFTAVDPVDATHLFFALDEGTAQTYDSGSSFATVSDRQFGITDLASGLVSGSGDEIYAGAAGSAIWHSDDLGTTWTRTPTPAGGGGTAMLVSRDDPRVAYTSGSQSGALRTSDGGAHWELMPQSRAIAAIEPGSPNHLFASGSDGVLSESLDAGSTWTAAPQAACRPVGGSDGRVVCADLGRPPGPLSTVAPPFAYGLSGAPGAPGLFAIAWAGLLGEVTGDWMLTDALAPTGAFGPPPGALTAGLAAWPAHDGTTFYGYDGTQNITWVRRGSGRWWRFQADGNPLSLLVPLTATHALAWKLPTPQNGIPTALAVVDLTHPSVTPPTVQIGPGELTCAVPWPASDADISAYAWLRDGSPVPGADGATFAPRPADRGHDLTCRATARTDFGATSVTAGNSYRDPPGANAFRVRLTGQPRYGATLRCSIAPRVTWLRGGKAVRDRHERSYRVGAADEGRTLACRATVDGIVVRSAAVRIPPPHGGRATLARVSP